MGFGGIRISSKRFRRNRSNPDEHLTSALRGLNCQRFRNVPQTFFSHATYMNSLSLELEGSRGQNEPGIFLGRNARLTIPVGKPIGQAIPRPGGMVNIIPISSLGILYNGIRLISGGFNVFGGVLDQFQVVSAKPISTG